jgi:hypothetical protein
LLSRIAHPWRIRAIIDARTPIETARDAHRMPHPAEPPRQRVVIAHRASSSRPAPDLGDEHSLVNLGQPSQKNESLLCSDATTAQHKAPPGRLRAQNGAPLSPRFTRFRCGLDLSEFEELEAQCLYLPDDAEHRGSILEHAR